MLISHKDHTGLFRERYDPLEAGHSCQGTSEPITPASRYMCGKGGQWNTDVCPDHGRLLPTPSLLRHHGLVSAPDPHQWISLPKVDIDISSISMVKVGVDLLYWRGLVSTELVAQSLHMQHQVSVRSRHWRWRHADRPSSLSRLWIVCADTGCLWLAITSSEALVAVNNLSRRCCILIYQFWAGVVTLGWRRWGQFSVLPRSQKASSEADYCRGL